MEKSFLIHLHCSENARFFALRIGIMFVESKLSQQESGKRVLRRIWNAKKGNESFIYNDDKILQKKIVVFKYLLIIISSLLTLSNDSSTVDTPVVFLFVMHVLYNEIFLDVISAELHRFWIILYVLSHGYDGRYKVQLAAYIMIPVFFIVLHTICSAYLLFYYFRKHDYDGCNML